MKADEESAEEMVSHEETVLDTEIQKQDGIGELLTELRCDVESTRSPDKHDDAQEISREQSANSQVSVQKLPMDIPSSGDVPPAASHLSAPMLKAIGIQLGASDFPRPCLMRCAHSLMQQEAALNVHWLIALTTNGLSVGRQ